MSTTPNPKVAVLCAIHEGDSVYLAEKALRSIVSQEYPREQINIYLYVDGPLTRAQEYFLDTHTSWFHRVIRSDINRGLPAGLNALLKSTNGEQFLFRMDVDDVVSRKRFRRQVDFMIANPEIDLCGSNTFEIDDQDRVIFERNYPETHEEIVRRLPRCNPMLHPTFCIRAESWKRMPVRYRNLYLNEDLGFVFDVIKHGWRLHNLQERLLYWRTGEAFHRRRNQRRARVELEAYLDGIFRLWGFSPKLIWPVARYLFRLLPRTMAKPLYRTAVRNHVLG